MKRKTKVCVADGMDKNCFEELCRDNIFDVCQGKSKFKREEILSFHDVEALVIRSATVVDAELLESLSQLKIVIRAGEGTDNIDKELCRKKGIAVCNTPGANNNSAAEHAISLMFAAARKTSHAHQSMQSGKWEKSLFGGLELWKKRLGIVGLGRIGRIVAQRLSGFEMPTSFFDPFVTDSETLRNWKKCETLEELFSTSDIVTVHVPLLEQTKALIDKKLLKQLPHQALFINAARGPIVHEKELIDFLGERTDIMAGLDVFETEPLSENSPLRQLPNVVLTPHVGASTKEAQERVGGIVIESLRNFFNEGITQHSVL